MYICECICIYRICMKYLVGLCISWENKWTPLFHTFNKKNSRAQQCFFTCVRLSASVWKAQQKGKQVFREIFSLSNSQARIKVIRNKKESKCTENIFIRDCEPRICLNTLISHLKSFHMLLAAQSLLEHFFLIGTF